MANPALAESLHEKGDGQSWVWIVLPIMAILLGHWMVDTLSAVIPTLLGVVEAEYRMNPQWSAILLGLGSIFSGTAQPIFAWLSDRWNTRIFGALGILLAMIGIAFIGLAQNVPSVFLLYAVGMMGVGMFHPIAASTIGRIAGNKRGLALSWFFVFGMAGFVTGSLWGPHLATPPGSLDDLSYIAIPALIVMVLVQVGIGKIEHRAPVSANESTSMSQYDWRSLGFLYFSCVFRFVVNMALVYLLVRWMEAYFASENPSWSIEQVANEAAPFVGRANASMIVGQLFGGLLAGALIANRREKIWLVLVPIIFAPSIILLAFLEPGVGGYAAVFFTGLGFGSMTPVAISVGQRLMPFHTSLASGLMLGGAWTIASLGPLMAEFLHKRMGLTNALIAVGITLALSGVAATGLNPNSMKK